MGRLIPFCYLPPEILLDSDVVRFVTGRNTIARDFPPSCGGLQVNVIDTFHFFSTNLSTLCQRVGPEKEAQRRLPLERCFR